MLRATLQPYDQELAGSCKRDAIESVCSARFPGERDITRASGRVVAVHEPILAVEQVFEAQSEPPAGVQRVTRTQIDQRVSAERRVADVLRPGTDQQFDARARAIAQVDAGQTGQFLLRTAQQGLAAVAVAVPVWVTVPVAVLVGVAQSEIEMLATGAQNPSS